MTTPIDYLTDKDTSLEARVACSAAAMHLANCMVQYARAKQKNYTRPGAKAEALREAKAQVSDAILLHNASTEALARAYDDALITVHNRVHNTYPQIHRRDLGTVCDPSMEAYHQM